MSQYLGVLTTKNRPSEGIGNKSKSYCVKVLKGFEEVDEKGLYYFCQDE